MKFIRNLLKWFAIILLTPIAIVLLFPIAIIGASICGMVRAIKSVFD